MDGVHVGIPPSLPLGLGLEEELPDYDLDSEDEEWLNAQTNERVRPVDLFGFFDGHSCVLCML